MPVTYNNFFIKSLFFGIGLSPLVGITDATEGGYSNDTSQSLASAVGTIVCDEKIRGSAAHISLPGLKHQEKSVLISAAHVFFDSKTGQAFNSCQYRPQNKRFTAVNIDIISTSHYEVSGTDKIVQAENDMVFLMLDSRLQQPSLELSKESVNSKSVLALIAFSAYSERIVVSDVCSSVRILQPLSKKLLLHDCKAQAGTSGGAIVDTVNRRVVAIHGGALVFDQTSFKSGSNDSNPSLERYQVPDEKLINQGRIIDSELISDLESFISANNKH